MEKTMELKKATAADVKTVADMYESVKGGEFSVWSEDYPTADHALQDMRAGCLYILISDGECVGCIAVEPVAEDDDLPFWRVNDGNHREVSRVAVHPDHQGKGYAKIMTQMLIERLQSEGASSIHLLAAKKNLPAVRTYRSLGFDFIGECFRYGADYFVCEKILSE